MTVCLASTGRSGASGVERLTDNHISAELSACFAEIGVRVIRRDFEPRPPRFEEGSDLHYTH